MTKFVNFEKKLEVSTQKVQASKEQRVCEAAFVLKTPEFQVFWHLKPALMRSGQNSDLMAHLVLRLHGRDRR